MKFLWLILTLVPVPFLFHFFEYGQHITIEPSLLFLVSILFVVVTGILAGLIKIRYVLLVNVITGFLSLLLAMFLIPDDGAWFKPVGRDLAIIFTAIVILVGQLIVSLFSRKKLTKLYS